VLTLCDAPLGRGGTWNREGVILFSPTSSSPIQSVPAAGGTTTPVTTPKNVQSHRWPYFLPDGRHFLYVAGSPYTPQESPVNEIMVASLDSKESKLLFRNHSNATYGSGHILFVRQNALMAQPFDVKKLELAGEALSIANPVKEDTGRIHGAFSASENGIVSYVEETNSVERQLLWVDRSGKKVGESPGPDTYSDPEISPDGKKLSFTLQSPGLDIWIEDIARGVKTRLTFSSSAQANNGEIWSRDGRQLAYSCSQPAKFGLCLRPADGSGNEEVIVVGNEYPRYPDDWSPTTKSSRTRRRG
jgi:eukaryotic-like serine/threonine-protein kinase